MTIALLLVVIIFWYRIRKKNARRCWRG